MATCPKCFKQNPPDALFCGFCGANIGPAEAPETGAKTMFGYSFDPDKAAAQPAVQAPEPDPAPEPAGAAPAPAPAPEAATPSAALIAGKYSLAGAATRLAAGELFVATSPEHRGKLDLLLVDKAVFQSPLDMERARRELRQLQKVECPAIVQVFDHGKAEDDRLFVAMEQVQGRTLSDVVAGGPLDLAEAQRVVKGVGTGLAEAQKMGVIHRDIAPHNVILGQDGQIKVRGFGIAAPIKRHVSGTPEFISPEQAAGRPVDQRSNIYSLGALMYYMLTGEPPFSGENVEEILNKHQQEEPTAPSKRRPELQLPPRAEALILKALAKSSSRRHLTLRQFLREVDSLAAVATAPQTEQVKEQPLSFETPLHGVTALQSGQRPPPSSELEPVKLKKAAADDSPTLDDGLPEAPPPAAADLAKTMIDPTAPPAAAPVAPAPAVAAGPEPATSHRRAQVTGEMSSDVKLKEADPSAHPPAPQPAASLSPSPAPTPAAPPAQKGKGAFRETMWFYKGEVESAMAEDGSEEAAPKPEGEVSPDELAAKYADDGSLDDEAARRLSLRTGKTQMMQKVNVPSGQLPGERMDDKELIGEISTFPRTALYIIIAVILAGVGGLVAYLVVS